MIDRRGAVPRSWLLLLFLAISAVVMVFAGVRHSAPELTLGGPLFSVSVGDIEGLLLTRQGLQYRFDRGPEGNWSLSGAVDDYLEPQAMTALVEMLTGARGGALLPGTEIEDRRYDFNGPEAMRLRVFAKGGVDFALALGTRNPVTGNNYASGVGRSGCFTVSGTLRDKIAMLPGTVLSQRLLPPFDPTLVREMVITRSGSDHYLRRRDHQWWLRWDDGGSESLRGLPLPVQEYQRLYADRRRVDDTGVWLMAAAPAVGQLIYEISSPTVREIISPKLASARRHQWALDPPWRQVVLRGIGLNSDPSAPVQDQFTVAFGTPLANDRVPVLRRGNVLVTDLEAIKTLDAGLEALVEQSALNAIARQADQLVVEREGHVLLRAARTGTSVTAEGREAWQTTVPDSGAGGLRESERHGLSQDLVVNLNRVAILKALPATTDARVLDPAEQVRITLRWEVSGPPRELVLIFGFLDPAHLPAGTGTLARIVDRHRAVGLWWPATGKLLQTSDQILVTVRSVANLLADVEP